MDKVKLTEFWYAALRSEIGICLQCSDRDRVRNELYAQRTELADPELDLLFLTASRENETDLWIMKKKVEVHVPTEE